MKRFLKHFFYLLLLLPVLIPVATLTYCTAQEELVYDITVPAKITVTEADGTVLRTEYTYDNKFENVTIAQYENDTLLDTVDQVLTEEDHQTAPGQVFPHPTAAGAASERSEQDSVLTITYFDPEGNAEGRSEMTYRYDGCLVRQRDYDAEGNLLRTTMMTYTGMKFYAIVDDETTAPTE